MLSNNKKMYKCPFCFESFTKGAHHFRARSTFEVVKDYSSGSFQLVRGKRLSGEEVDECFKRYLMEFFGYTDSIAKEKAANYALVSKDLAVPHKKGYITYDKSYLRETGDRQEPFRADKLDFICPLCHNRLPDNYETARELTIAVIGNTGAGKTVYFTALYYILSISKFIDERDIANKELAGNLVDLKNKLFDNHELHIEQSIGEIVEPTKKTDVVLPYIFLCVDTYGEEFNTVLYDIAGENCAGEDAANWLDKRAKHLTEVDSIIFLVDAEALEDKDEAAGQISVVKNICANLYNSIPSHRINTPVAVALSKSDMVAKLSEGFDLKELKPRGTRYNAVSYDNKRRQDINRFTKSYINSRDKNGIIIDQIESIFSEAAFYCFFASVVDYKELGIHRTPRFITDAFLWIMYKKGYIMAEDEGIEPKRRWWPF